MAFLSSMNVVGSGLTAQQLRLDVSIGEHHEQDHHADRGGRSLPTQDGGI